MGFREWFGGGSAAKKVEAPEAAPQEEVLEAKREQPEAPKLTVVEGGAEKKEAPVATSASWATKAGEATQKAGSLFDRANKFFREQKESQGNGKWVEGPHKEAWKLGCAQIPLCEQLSIHSKSLEEAEAEWTATMQRELPIAPLGEEEPLLASSGASLAERNARLDAIMERERAHKKQLQDLEAVKARVYAERAAVERLQRAYDENEVKMAALEAQIDGRMGGKEQNLYNISMAAYDRLVKAEDNLKKARGGILTRIKGFFSIEPTKRDAAIYNAEKEVAAAEEAVKAIEERYDESGLRGTASAARAQAEAKIKK